MSVILAERFGLDVERCLLAALLHDLAKPYPKDLQKQMLSDCRMFAPSEEDMSFPSVWHGLVAAQEAVTTYGVEDREVLEAVAYHSTGRRGIGPIGLAIYVADFTEPSRRWEGVEAARAELLGKDNLTEAARHVAQYKLRRLQQQGKPTHPLTIEMGQWLESTMEKGNPASC